MDHCDELDDAQRARLHIFAQLQDLDGVVDLDSIDLLRVAHWVATGQHPDTDPQSETRSADVHYPERTTEPDMSKGSYRIEPANAPPGPWQPAVT
jgi:hypothetical protein